MARKSDAVEWLLPALLVLGFGYFALQDRMVSFCFLAVFTALLIQWIWRASREEILRTVGFCECRSSWVLTGVAVGIGLGGLLRWVQGGVPYLTMPGFFFLVAAMIGATEELIFRGYFQGMLQRMHSAWLALMGATVLHAGYKVALFVSDPGVNLLVLGGATLVVGLFIGYARLATGSIWPCIAFHTAFDIWVYGDRTTPWWIW